MTNLRDFLNQAEADLRSSRVLSALVRQSWEDLPNDSQNALASAMRFLGCEPNGSNDGKSNAANQEDRIAAARLMLLKLEVDTDNPKWSSEVLRRLLQNVVNTPGGSVGDLFFAVYDVLNEFSPALTDAVAHFLKELVVESFTQHRTSYESIPWSTFVDATAASDSPALLYLAMHAVPPQFVTPALSTAIINSLQATTFQDEANRLMTVSSK